MKPLSWDKQLGLASPLKCAAIQSGQTNPSMDKVEAEDEVGLDASHHIRIFLRGGENLFSLTSSFIGSVNRVFALTLTVELRSLVEWMRLSLERPGRAAIIRPAGFWAVTSEQPTLELVGLVAATPASVPELLSGALFRFF
jgi:hypothetical protein